MFASELHSSLLSAMSTANTALVDILLTAGAKINYSDPRFLENAANGNCLTIVNEMLAYNVEHNVFRMSDINNAVKAAAKKGHIEVVRSILSAGADPKYIDEYTLSQTLCSGHADTAMVLIDAGVSIGGQKRGMSPLMGAVFGGCTEVVKYLINNSADVNYVYAYDRTCRTALSYASKPDIVRILLDAKADVKPRRLYPVIFTASTKFEHNSVKMMLDARADPQIRVRFSDSPLYMTLRSTCPEDKLQEKAKTIDILLTAISSRERSIDEEDCLNRFSLAAESGSVLDVFLKKFPKLLEYVDSKGMTALYMAVAEMSADKVCGWWQPEQVSITKTWYSHCFFIAICFTIFRVVHVPPSVSSWTPG